MKSDGRREMFLLVHLRGMFGGGQHLPSSTDGPSQSSHLGGGGGDGSGDGDGASPGVKCGAGVDDDSCGLAPG